MEGSGVGRIHHRGHRELRERLGRSVKSVDEYIEGQPEERRAKLEEVRAAILGAAPHAEEVVSYGMAGYKLAGKRLLFFAGWKKFYSLYPVGRREREVFADELKGLEVEGSTLRLPWTAKIPVGLIQGLVRLRAEGVLAPPQRTQRTQRKAKGKGA